MKLHLKKYWQWNKSITLSTPRLFVVLACLLLVWALFHWLPAAWQGKGLEGDDKILAKVKGRCISQYDVSMELSMAVGDLSGNALSDQSRKEMLESLVQRRAIARVREKEMNRKEKSVLEKQVESYREKLLVRQYLSKHAENVKLAEAEIKQYYEEHLAQFGGRTVKIYELLAGMEALDARKRDEFVKTAANAAGVQDWKKWSAELFQKGYGVRYLSGTADEKILQPEIRSLLAPLQKGQTSSLTFIEGKPHLARVLETRMTAAKPLDEVRTEIGKILMPRLYKTALKQVSDEVMRKTRVKSY